MAHHKSALKRNRANETRRVENKFQAKTMRNALKSIRVTEDKKEAESMLPKVNALIDKLAKKNVIHKNKAANLKSSIAKKASSL